MVRLSMLFVGLSLCGCGPSYVIVKGKITKGGEPLGMKDYRVMFVTTEMNGDAPVDMFLAQLDSAGTFIVRGPTNKGIPRGEYRIAIILLGKDGIRDKLDDMFGPTTSRIIRKVDGKDIDIDIDRPEG